MNKLSFIFKKFWVLGIPGQYTFKAYLTIIRYIYKLDDTMTYLIKIFYILIMNMTDI